MIRWSELAELRVAEAYSFIAQDRPEAAERWFTRVLTRLDLLVTHPESGRIVPEAGRADIREVLVRPYRIMYRVDPNRVLVLTVQGLGWFRLWVGGASAVLGRGALFNVSLPDYCRH